MSQNYTYGDNFARQPVYNMATTSQTFAMPVINPATGYQYNDKFGCFLFALSIPDPLNFAENITNARLKVGWKSYLRKAIGSSLQHVLWTHSIYFRIVVLIGEYQGSWNGSWGGVPPDYIHPMKNLKIGIGRIPDTSIGYQESGAGEYSFKNVPATRSIDLITIPDVTVLFQYPCWVHFGYGFSEIVNNWIGADAEVGLDFTSTFELFGQVSSN